MVVGGLVPWVCARWCPTLPHPGGCSTIGAGSLSFRVRNGAGRCLPAMTTETFVVSQPVCVIGVVGCVFNYSCCWFGCWCLFWGGLVVDRIVGACGVVHAPPFVCVGGCCLWLAY